MKSIHLIQKHKQYIPLLLLTLSYIDEIISIVLNQNFDSLQITFDSFRIKNYITIFALLLNNIIYFLKPKYFKYVFIPTLVLGFFNLVSFYVGESSIFSMSVNRGPLGTELQPIAVFTCLITYLINFKRFNNFILDKS